MAIINYIKRIFNGTEWDTYYPKTTASQVEYGNSTVHAVLGSCEAHMNNNRYVYWHNFSVSESQKPASTWNWIGNDDITLNKDDIPSGIYEVTYSLTARPASGEGVLTTALYTSGKELTFNKSRQTVPLKEGVYSSVNASAYLISDGTKSMTINIKAWADVAFIPSEAFIYVKRIGNSLNQR